MWTPTIALLPGALTIYLGFDGGGYFPQATGVACALVAVALVLRITLAPRPLEGVGLAVGLVLAALALFGAWAIISTSWSDAPARAVVEFDRVLLYTLTLALLGTLPRTAATARTVLAGIATAAAFVCVAGLLTRILPDALPIEPNVLAQRLSYPITYWNGLGLLAALAIVFATHFAASAKEHTAARVAASALLPLLAATLLFTFSRASIVMAAVGVVAYVLIARPRALPPALLAVLPTAAISVVWAYNADLLAKPNPTTAGAVDQGQEVFVVLLVCAAAAGAIRYALIRLAVDERLEALEVAPRTRRVAAFATAGALLLGLGGAWIALDLGDRIERQYDRFRAGDTIQVTEDARDRLTDVGNNGRIDHWDEALDAWRDEPLRGTGAGTYELTWAQHRPTEFTVRDGHSLYLETLSELGLVGGLLLLAALLGILVALALRTRAPDRALWAALLTGGIVWTLHAGQDWVWELPSVTLWLFAAGGVALARPEGAPETRIAAPGRLPRVVVALGVLALAVTPVLNALADARIRDSVTALKAGDCEGAIDDALAATSTVSARAEPYAVLAFCDVRLGEPMLAERMMRTAVERDPNNWIYRYGLALVLAVLGEDPRGEIAEARRLNPLEGKAIRLERAFNATDDPGEWRRRALRARLPIQ
ncbi:MAG TPA: O-antigen ligase family protein [Thermoleophilaceae bacterium]|nr:O-antigen ligase family protein [Thermoleophilaceae bacterium]